MRDNFEGTGAGTSSATEPSDSPADSEESRRLFLDVLFSMASYDAEILLEDVCEDSLPEMEGVCAVLRRMNRGMVTGSVIKLYES